MKDIDERTAQKLAGSLTASDPELLLYLPYLLQDLWALGTLPELVCELVRGHIPEPGQVSFLDLACGKGAVSVSLARAFGCRVDGFDLFPEFVEYARARADEESLGRLCRFETADVKEVVQTARGYGGVIFGAAGDILGSPAETVSSLAAVVNPHGYILIDDAYLRESGETVKYDNYPYLTRSRWLDLFTEQGLELIAEETSGDSGEAGEDVRKIETRAGELAAKYPEQRALFEGYVRSQWDEVGDLDQAVCGVVWLLRREESR